MKKNHYCSDPLFHKVELTALWGLGLCPSKKTLFVVSLVVWIKLPLFAYNDHRCSLSHASRLHSMHPSFGDGASLAGSSKEIAGSSSKLKRQYLW